jgi:hypothetical protein
MRALTEKAGREVTPKFEDDVERLFRRFCEGDSVRAGVTDISEELFYRPQGTAGEVWAIGAKRARAWTEFQLCLALTFSRGGTIGVFVQYVSRDHCSAYSREIARK